MANALIDKLSAANLPPRLGRVILDLVNLAETSFGEKTGTLKREWVVKAALSWAESQRDVNNENVPDWIENVAESEAFVRFAVNVVWAVVIGPAGAIDEVGEARIAQGIAEMMDRLKQ